MLRTPLAIVLGMMVSASALAADGIATETKIPLLITLHASGRIGSSLVDKWRGLAEKSKFIVAGPDSLDRRGRMSPDDGPQLLYDLVEDYFAAVAIHAGQLPPDAYSLTTFATRKIPFAMIVGTRDPLFPLDGVRATRDHLQKTGFAVELTEIRNHTHDYYGRAGSINEQVWTFLQQHALAREPRFTVYPNM
jgi:poly(3-hydroxybutyrate) depolymerase